MVLADQDELSREQPFVSVRHTLDTFGKDDLFSVEVLVACCVKFATPCDSIGEEHSERELSDRGEEADDVRGSKLLQKRSRLLRSR